MSASGAGRSSGSFLFLLNSANTYSVRNVSFVAWAAQWDDKICPLEKKNQLKAAETDAEAIKYKMAASAMA